MILAAHALLIIGLLMVCCLAPGFFLVRRLRFTPMEKLCASIGLSLILLYLVSFIVYLAGGPGTGSRLPGGPFAITSALCVALALAARKDLLRVLRSFRVKQALLGYGFLLLWTIVILGMIRVYSGGQWSGDWQEHFQRTLFFTHRLPMDTAFGELYRLPARPPFMNLLAAFFLAQTDDRFELFQLTFTFLNLLVFLPACLLLPSIAAARHTRILPLVLLFALNPVMMQHATYTWTRSLTAFFVLLGVALYLTAWRKNERLRMIAAFVSLAAGILVHYSAGPYVLFVTLHYISWLFWKRPHRWREFGAVSAVCALLLASWFGWATAVYGKSALTSAATVSVPKPYQGSRAEMTAGNLFDTIVPAVIRDPSLMDQFDQPNPIGRFRDLAFVFYHPNVIFGMGIIGGPAILWLSFRRLRRKHGVQSGEKAFWFALVLGAGVAGVAVVGGRESLGTAYGTLLSLELIGLVLLAGAIRHRRRLMTLVLVGAVLDFCLGIFLHSHVQSLENSTENNFFVELEFSSGIVRQAQPGPQALSRVAWQNWFEKHRWALTSRWLEDLPRQHGQDPTFQIVWPPRQAEILTLKKQDELQWGGWYSRHNGEITYLGDHVEHGLGNRVAGSTLLALLAGLVAVFIRRMPAAPLPQQKPRKVIRGQTSKSPKLP